MLFVKHILKFLRPHIPFDCNKGELFNQYVTEYDKVLAASQCYSVEIFVVLVLVVGDKEPTYCKQYKLVNKGYLNTELDFMV
jgi:hypothetical protein